MPPKDGSDKGSESKTKKWTRVPRLPHEEDERNEKSENVPKLPRKGKRNPRSQKTTKADEAQELEEEKPDKSSKFRLQRRRNTASRRGQPPAKKAAESAVPHEEKQGKDRNEELLHKESPEHKGKAVDQVGEDEGGWPESVPSEVEYSSEVDEIPERLFRGFFSQRTDMQAFVGIMRIFQNARDKTMQRIHQLVITMLLDDFQSFPYWPEKELLMVGELLGQFIRWDLIPDGGPLQLALCCILSALKEPPASLLYRFGQRALEQFLCRFAHHDVASQMCRQMQVSQRPIHEEELKQEDHRLHLNPMMLPAQPAVFMPWPWFPVIGIGQQPDLLMRMLISQGHTAAPSSNRAHNAGRPKVQQEISKWMFGNASKAAPRPAGSKQGILSWQEPDKERREKDRDCKTSKKKTSAKKKANVEKTGSSGTATLPPFIEVDMESMEFQLSDEDVPAEKAAEEKKRNEDKKQEDTGGAT